MFSGQLLFEVYYALLSLQIFCLNEQAAYLGFVRNRCDFKKYISIVISAWPFMRNISFLRVAIKKTGNIQALTHITTRRRN